MTEISPHANAARSRPTLFIFAGLPGTGKTTLSRRLAQAKSAVHLRIDTIEQALRDFGHAKVDGDGYKLAYRIAADNLELGIDVVADSCNPVELTRDEWERVARQNGAAFVNIEVVCSDSHEHRRRIESRIPDVARLVLPTWREVEAREYHGWSRDRMIVDTALRTETDCFASLMDALDAAERKP